MEEVHALLKRWGLSQPVIDRFRENQIRFRHLTKLTEYTIEKLIPNAGERIDFMDHLQQYKDKHQDVSIDQFTSVDTSCITDKDKESEKSDYTSSTSSVASVASNNVVHSQACLPTQADKFIPSTSRQTSEKDFSDPPAKRLRVENNEYDLLTLLQSSTYGKMILGHFHINECLNNDMRKMLADEIINKELSIDINARISTERVEFLTKEVIKLFPSEIEALWKGAYGQGKNRRETSAGRGMLIQRYYNIRRKLRKCGILSKESSQRAHVEELVTSDEEFDDNVDDDVQWLKNNSKPWAKVLELWDKTSKNRLESLKKKGTAVHVYMDLFPALKTPNGYLLLELDFNKMYPTSGMKLYTELSNLTAFIKKKITIEKERSSIDDCSTPDGKKIRTLLALNLLFTVVTVWKKKQEQWRPSRQESREAFLLFVKTTSDIEPTLNLRKEKYIKYGKNLGVQAVIIGADLDCIKYSYVIINDIWYEVETPFKAIDIAFKAMQALDSIYPIECAREWLFLQRGVYEITTSHDKDISNPKVLAMIEEYLKFKSLLQSQ
ncbi:uncharacterized protein [Temnothorax longispinosus]|uniref:uncharacterized protein n=1 Tax=Temnothorax longispinosus TaxID=300112 RepID=UPI003A99F4B8